MVKTFGMLTKRTNIKYIAIFLIVLSCGSIGIFFAFINDEDSNIQEESIIQDARINPDEFNYYGNVEFRCWSPSADRIENSYLGSALEWSSWRAINFDWTPKDAELIGKFVNNICEPRSKSETVLKGEFNYDPDYDTEKNYPYIVLDERIYEDKDELNIPGHL